MKKYIIEEKIKNQKGITLLVLVITIIILLILAGITISAITGDNGIIGNAGQAKEETEIANEKEIVEKATVQAMGNNKYGKIKQDELQKQLDKETGEGKTEATDIGDEFEVVFNESNRYYTVDKDGNVGEVQEIIKDENPGDITIGKDGEILDGSEEHPYEIWCIEDLVTFSNMVNGTGIKLENGNPVEITTANNFSGKYVILKTNLNFKSKLSYNDSEATIYGDLNTDGIIEDIKTELTKEDDGCIGFKCIGTERSNPFQGSFDGKNKELKNIYQKQNVSTPIALFGGISNAIIKDLTITGTITNESWHAAGICGGGTGEIINCKNYADVTGSNMVGGISANTYGNITSCQNYGTITITGMSYAYGGAGGIIGTVTATGNIIKDCMNEGKILGSTSQVGGIVGTIQVNGNVEINGCYNTGKSNNAGILGFMRNGIVTVANSYNLGECRNGIVGSFNGGSWDVVLELNIQNSYNLGKVSNAGIIGTERNLCRTITLNIDNCYNAGESDKAIVGTTDKHSSTETVTNIENTYYEVTKSSSIGAISEGITEMNIQNNTSFVEILNNNIGSNTTWKTWKLGEEGYPVFE